MARLLKEGQAVWANSAPQNTTKDIDIPSDPDGGHRKVVVIRNPSLVSALTIKVKVKEPTTSTFGGGSDRYSTLTTLNVLVNQPEGVEFAVADWDLTDNAGRLTLSNDTVLGGGDGFTADVRVRVEEQPN